MNLLNINSCSLNLLIDQLKKVIPEIFVHPPSLLLP